MQRIVAIAPGYEDLNDHDRLRRDPVPATLAGKLRARRKGCEPLAGKSTLNRLEHAPDTKDGSQKACSSWRKFFAGVPPDGRDRRAVGARA